MQKIKWIAMDTGILDVIVIGAGHAGLSISYLLKKHNLNHIVFEKGRIGDSWLNQRWDSFKLNSPNKYNTLPGDEFVFPDEEGFCSAPEFVSYLEEYSKKFNLPVIENCKVISVEKIHDSNDFSVCVSDNGNEIYYRSNQVVIASGAQNQKNIPSFANNISSEIQQLHANEYKNPSFLPDGAVLVVGSAQSGLQVAEDLIEAGRKVFISTSQVGRIPRRYRGKDVFDWFIILGIFDLQTEKITDPQILRARTPQVSGVGLRGHTVSLQDLARKGAVILGRADKADSHILYLQENAAKNVKFSDDFSKMLKNMADDYIQKNNLSAPFPEPDPADEYDETCECVSNITSLNLKENNINSIIWTTGFDGDFNYLKLPVLDETGMLKHHNGISDIEGLYFLGFPWLRKRKSGIVLGIAEDAEFIAEKLLARKSILT